MHRTDFIQIAAWIRATALMGIVTLGLIGIVGSGGGVGLGLPSDCPPGWDCTTLPAPQHLVQPDYVTAQVGTPVTFSIIGSNYPAAALTYQWYRSSDGGAHYVAIAGATTDTLTLASVNLADDNAIYQGSAVNVNGRSGSAMGRLAVSPGPGVVFADGEFPAASWVAAPLADGKTTAPTHSEETLATGGHPGAYRKMIVQFPSQTSTAVLGYTSTAASYEPQTQGAILVIDYAEEGFAPQPLSVQITSSALLLEQGGRRYITTTRNSYDRLIAVWDVSQKTPSLRAADFKLYDGPVCQAGEPCPDFSSSGKPMRFGYWRISSGSPGVSVNHGIDNWKVTVWKR